MVSSRSLVIDASVLQSAGGMDRPDEGSKRCSIYLDAVANHDHRAALTKEIEAEWNRHRTRFSSRWLRLMTTRSRIARLENVKDDDLRAQVQNMHESIGDVHLIEAAIHADRIVSSCDNTARRRYARVSGVISDIASIMWTNPSEEEDGGANWIALGAPFEDARTLANAPQTRVE